MARAQATGSGTDFLPDKLSLSALREAATAYVTIHPSAILRREPEQRERELAAFVADLVFVASLL